MAGNAAQRTGSAAFPPDLVRVVRPEHLLPDDHAADEHVFLLHCEEAAQRALGEIELAHAPASRGSMEAANADTLMNPLEISMMSKPQSRHSPM